MNHNFKLKPSETSVTNDAELFNYTLKNTCENMGSRRRSHFSSCCFPLTCFLLSDDGDVRQVAAHLSFPIFNTRNNTHFQHSYIQRLSVNYRGLTHIHSIRSTSEHYRSDINQHQFTLPFAKELFFLSLL